MKDKEVVKENERVKMENRKQREKKEFTKREKAQIKHSEEKGKMVI